MTLTGLLTQLAGFDPAPLFALSLFPYLAFLWWAWRSGRMPRLARIGFALTLLFVAVTIAAALVAEGHYGRQLADVDPLHGGAEAFLTLSNLLVLLGFSRQDPAALPRLDRSAGAMADARSDAMFDATVDQPGG